MAYPISDVPRRIVYSGSAGVGPYAFTFEVLANTDIAVYKNTTLLTLTTDYTVSINIGTGTGTVTLVVAATSSDTVTIVGDRAIQRTSDFVTGGDLFANTLNDELDAQVIYTQQVDEKADRAIKAPVTDPTTINMTLPSSTVRASKALGFTASGNPTQSSSTLAAIDAAVTTLQTLAAASPGSSAGISHIAAGTGAVATTVQAKLRETVSVKDFNAVGDGVTDDTAAIQAALNSGAKTVHLKSDETYLISSTLTVPAGVVIQGNGATIVSNTHFKVLDFADGGGGFNLRMTGPGGGSYVTGSIAIGCSGTNNAPAAPTYVTGPVIENCTINGFGEYGIFLEYVKVARIAGNNITSVGYAGVGGVSCEDVIVDGNVIKNITAGSPGGDAYGVFIDRNDGASETAEPRSYRCIITNNLIENISATAANNGQGIDTHAGVDFIIDSNKIANCEAGIFLTASSISGVQELGPIRCVVSNNIIQSTAFVSYGILVYGARTGATVAQHAEDCVISGNILVGHGLKTSGTVPGVFLSATKNVTVTGNVFKQCGGSCLMLDFQNIGFNISGNQFIDPQSTTYATPSCVLVYSIDNRGYIGGNTYRYENAALATYVAVNSVRIESGLTGLDIDFGRSTFQGIDATHLTFNALTTDGVRYSGLHYSSGSDTIAVSSGVADGITDVTFSKRFPYAPNVTVTLRRPFNQGGKFPILGVDTSVAISATGFRIYALPYDGTTWTATGSLSFDWQAN